VAVARPAKPVPAGPRILNQCKAAGVRLRAGSPDRRNIRKGYRCRGCDTRAGSIELAVPKLREGSYFPEWLLERRRRGAESAPVSVVAICYLLGVSTRGMEKLVKTLGMTGLSKSQVSEMAKDLDSHVEASRTRPLDASPYTFVVADALVLKVAKQAARSTGMPCWLPEPTPTATRDPRPARHLGRGGRQLAGVLPASGFSSPSAGQAVTSQFAVTASDGRASVETSGPWYRQRYAATWRTLRKSWSP
jgi:hypothetical protein